MKVAFTTGHGEPKPDDPGGKGLGNWRARLARVGCEVSELRLDQSDIPDDLALLIVVGPVDPFKPEEVAKIRAYLDRGKPVLLLLDGEHPTGLEDLLKSHNLEIGKGIVIDPNRRSNYNGNWNLVLASPRSGVDHPISAAMAPDRPVLLQRAAPIHIAGQSRRPGKAAANPVDKSLVPSAILRTSRTSWAETDLKNPRPTLDRSTDETRRDRRRGGLPPQGAAAAGRPGGGAAEARAVLLPLDGREHHPGDHAGQPRPAHERGELARAAAPTPWGSRPRRTPH